jgi:hypothetical protein
MNDNNTSLDFIWEDDGKSEQINRKPEGKDVDLESLKSQQKK